MIICRGIIDCQLECLQKEYLRLRGIQITLGSLHTWISCSEFRDEPLSNHRRRVGGGPWGVWPQSNWFSYSYNSKLRIFGKISADWPTPPLVTPSNKNVHAPPAYVYVRSGESSRNYSTLALAVQLCVKSSHIRKIVELILLENSLSYCKTRTLDLTNLLLVLLKLVIGLMDSRENIFDGFCSSMSNRDRDWT